LKYAIDGKLREAEIQLPVSQRSQLPQGWNQARGYAGQQEGLMQAQQEEEKCL
jgi:hypothetical protein